MNTMYKATHFSYSSCADIVRCSCHYELTSRMDPCLDGGGPSFSSRFILPHTMKMRMAVPTSKIKNNNMAITIPAIAPPPKPAADGKGEREIM